MPHTNRLAGLGSALDRREARGAFRISKQPEFLFSEEALVHRRSWSENLTYYTGLGYLAGEQAPGAWVLPAGRPHRASQRVSASAEQASML